MKNNFSENLILYIDKLKKEKGFNSDNKAIQCLISKISNIDQDNELSERAVRKWMNGETYPSITKVCILADIMNVSVDELLRDRISTIKDKKVPEWYKDLSDKSKQVVLKCLEPYKTGNFSKVKSRLKFENLTARFLIENNLFKKEFFDARETDKEEYMKILDNNDFVDYSTDFYFLTEGTHEDFKIFFDEYYDYNQVVSAQIKKHEKEFREYRFNNHIKNKKSYEELLKVIDFGYVECLEERGEATCLYGEENWISKEDGVRVTYEDFAEGNEHENQIPYFVRDEILRTPTDIKNPQKRKNIEGKIHQNISNVIENFFEELINKNILKIFDIKMSSVEFYDGNEDFNSKEYCKVSVLLNIEDEDIENILMLGIRENIKKTIEENKNFKSNQILLAKDQADTIKDILSKGGAI